MLVERFIVVAASISNFDRLRNTSLMGKSDLRSRFRSPIGGEEICRYPDECLQDRPHIPINGPRIDDRRTI